MIVEQIYTGCLAQGAYYIESQGEAAIIDPLREVTPYLEKAKKNGARIKYVFETHFHADFVSGHLTLSKHSKAPIVFGPNANPSFEAIIAEDGQVFSIGDLSLIVMHTPGHTMESTTYLLRDPQGNDHAIFTGDTLFLGDVGRPDLAQKAAHMTQEQLAETLFNSLRTKIMPLSDDVIVYPAHGAGSACGKNMMKETVDTLGNQKQMNYALRADMTKEEFVQEVLDGLAPPPQYFPANVKMNKHGYLDIENVLEKGTQALSPNAFELAVNETGAIVLDVRSPEEFAKGHIPRSIFVGLDGGFAPWVGSLIADTEHPICFVAPEGREKETITRLSRVGFDNTLGYLKGGIASWRAADKEVDTVPSVSAQNLKELAKENEISIFDVRKDGEYKSEHIPEAYHASLEFLNDHLSAFGRKKSFYVHCAGGYRSMIAISILKSRGIHNGINVIGGMKAIREVGITLSDYICPSTL